MNLAELLEKLGQNKKQAAEFYGKYKELREQEDALKFELTDKLHEMDLKTAKGNTFTASIAERPTIIIEHEQSVLDWLKQAPEIEEDAYIGLKRTEFQSFAKGLLKRTGELIDGTDVIITEYLNIRENKK
jgi:hypothetical protein